MKNNSTQFSLEENTDPAFDPWDEASPIYAVEAAEEFDNDYLGTSENAVILEQVIDDRPAQERIDELLTTMAPRKKVLFRIIGFCHEAQPVSAVNELVGELQKNNFSVYSPANLCALLERAGALELVTEDGHVAEEVEAEPATVVIDGVEYLEPAPTPKVYWVATEDGMAAVEADKPLERLRDLLEQDKQYAPMYKRVLTLCSQEGGASTKSLSDAVDKDPMVQKPRLYAPHFMDKLEKCDALAWTSTWTITDVGKEALELLADVEDTTSPLNTQEAL